MTPRDNSKKRSRFPRETIKTGRYGGGNGPFDTPEDGTTRDPHLD
jgi:hypothetical protein